MRVDTAIDVVARRAVNDQMRTDMVTLRKRLPGLRFGAYIMVLHRMRDLVPDPTYEELMEAHQVLSELQGEESK